MRLPYHAKVRKGLGILFIPSPPRISYFFNYIVLIYYSIFLQPLKIAWTFLTHRYDSSIPQETLSHPRHFLATKIND